MKIQELLSGKVSLVPWEKVTPERCRIILADKEATKIVGIVRKRRDHEPYVVFPGGGVEVEDKTPYETIRREVGEELDGLDESQYVVADEGFIIKDEYGEQFYFLGEIQNEIESFQMGGPELNRDVAASGTYEPQWFLLSDIGDVNFVPVEVKRLL